MEFNQWNSEISSLSIIRPKHYRTQSAEGKSLAAKLIELVYFNSWTTLKKKKKPWCHPRSMVIPGLSCLLTQSGCIYTCTVIESPMTYVNARSDQVFHVNNKSKFTKIRSDCFIWIFFFKVNTYSNQNLLQTNLQGFSHNYMYIT